MKKSGVILRRVYIFFVKSPDFNGIPITTLSKASKIEYIELIEIIKKLVLENKVSIQSDINPHIIALGHYDTQIQLDILEDAKGNETKPLSHTPGLDISFDTHLVCVYPSVSYLKKMRDVSDFSNKPFSSRLALGEAQLTATFFEMEVLDRYFKDPRYRFQLEDYSGEICYTDDENHVPLVSERDQIFLKSFGLGFDEVKKRVAVVYLCYLGKLTADHQAYWKTKEVTRKCQMVKEYYVNTIEGNWTTSYSVFSAFIGEQKALNDLSKALFGEFLFNRTFEDEKRPKEFTVFFIPTLKNYHDFILLLDKMLSDNINKKFFKDKVDLYRIEDVGDGVVERKEKGTLQLFQEWLSLNYNADSPELIKNLFQPLIKIRQERQSPAHRINENAYDKSLIEKQTEIVKNAYYTIKALRVIFQKHENSSTVKIPKWLDEGQVKIF